ncbi:MAG: hypothetical protein QOE66_1807 [Chloroflexota bacterium]|nr:hypothetical protein [Chloroflexota bacterium]
MGRMLPRFLPFPSRPARGQEGKSRGRARVIARWEMSEWGWETGVGREGLGEGRWGPGTGRPITFFVPTTDAVANLLTPSPIPSHPASSETTSIVLSLTSRVEAPVPPLAPSSCDRGGTLQTPRLVPRPATLPVTPCLRTLLRVHPGATPQPGLLPVLPPLGAIFLRSGWLDSSGRMFARLAGARSSKALTAPPHRASGFLGGATDAPRLL